MHVIAPRSDGQNLEQPPPTPTPFHTPLTYLRRKYRDISPHSRHTHNQPILAAAFIHAASPATRKRSLPTVWNGRGGSIVWFQVHGPDGHEPFPSACQQLRLHATQALQALDVRTHSDLHAFRDRIAQKPSVSGFGVAILTCIQAHTECCAHHCRQCFALSQSIPGCGWSFVKAAMRLMRQEHEESSQHPRHGAHYFQAYAYAHLEGSVRVVQKVSIVMSGDVVTSLVGRACHRA